MGKVKLTINQSFQYQGCRIVTLLDPSIPEGGYALTLFVQDTCEDCNYRRYQARLEDGRWEAPDSNGTHWVVPSTESGRWIQGFLDEFGHLIGQVC